MSMQMIAITNMCLKNETANPEPFRVGCFWCQGIVRFFYVNEEDSVLFFLRGLIAAFGLALFAERSGEYTVAAPG